MRSIERGLPLVLAANTGISAVIDPLGRILAQTQLNTRTTIDSRVPQSLDATFYARNGGLMLALLIAAAGFLLRGMMITRAA